MVNTEWLRVWNGLYLGGCGAENPYFLAGAQQYVSRAQAVTIGEEGLRILEVSPQRSFLASILREGSGQIAPLSTLISNRDGTGNGAETQKLATNADMMKSTYL